MSKRIFFLTSVAVLLVSYQNCSMDGDHEQFGFAFDSKGCASVLASTFQQTYYPVLQSKCVPCHDNGQGAGFFANPDFTTAFNAFQSYGRDRVEANMVNAGHHPPNTGPGNQQVINDSRASWVLADQAYATCNSSGQSITSTDKGDSAIFTSAGAGYTHLTWNLETDVAANLQGHVHLIIGIDVRQANQPTTAGPVIAGYEFKNPVAKITTGNAGVTYDVKGLHMILNGSVLPMSTFISLVGTVGSMTDVPLAGNGSATGLAVTGTTPATANTDVFAIKIDSITDGSGNPINSPAPGPTPGPALPTTVRFADLVSASPNLGIFAQSCTSCHSGAAPAGGVDLATYATAKAKAARVHIRMNALNGTTPMPPSGLLPLYNRQVVDVWINGGQLQ